METTTALGMQMMLDVSAVRRASVAQQAVDPGCCHECAVFASIVSEGRELAPLIAVLEQLGLDPLHPDEVWGAADGGFLEGWWSFTAALVGDRAAADFESSVLLAPGLSAWITDALGSSQLALDGRTEFLLEFHWESSAIVSTFESLFPAARRDAPA